MWVRTWLKQRGQSIALKGEVLGWREVTSGDP